MARAKPTDSTWQDPIVEEVRAARRDLFAACEYDLDKLVARLREGEFQRRLAELESGSVDPVSLEAAVAQARNVIR